MKEFEWFEWFESFEWFGPSPIEPFNSGNDPWSRYSTRRSAHLAGHAPDGGNFVYANSIADYLYRHLEMNTMDYSGQYVVAARVERFDRQGTEPFEPFEPFENFQNRKFP